MSKIDISAIEGRLANAKQSRIWKDADEADLSLADIPALINALEELRIKYDHINNFDNSQCKILIEQRDRWKARADVLERIIRNGLCVCLYCELTGNDCEICQELDAEGAPMWKFNEAIIESEGENE